jgi:hypothetical protein
MELAKLEIEQDVLAKMEMPAPWPECLGERFDRFEHQGWPSRADENRRDRHMKTIDDASTKKAGNRYAAALHKDAPVSLAPKRVDERCWFEFVSTVGGHRQDVIADGWCSIGVGGAPHDERSGGAIGENIPVRLEAPIGVENDTSRILASHCTDGQPGVVGRDRPRAHNHRIDQSTQSMEAANVSLPRHVVRVAAFGGDPPVEALSPLRDDEIGPPLER